MKKDKEFYIAILERLKVEANKRSEIAYDAGVDLTNYENGYWECARDLLVAVAPFNANDLEWWLFEDVDKVIYTDGRSRDVSKALDFWEFYEDA